MPGIALPSASKGRLRPSFFFLCTCAWPVLAQQAVYRCGTVYTNAPSDALQCVLLSPQTVTVIEGTRVQSSPLSARQGQPSAMPWPGASGAPGLVVREDLARAVLQQELVQARQRHEQLLQRQRNLPEDAEDKLRTELRATLERHQRDIDSLQRELQRRSSNPP